MGAAFGAVAVLFYDVCRNARHVSPRAYKHELHTSHGLVMSCQVEECMAALSHNASTATAAGQGRERRQDGITACFHFSHSASSLGQFCCLSSSYFSQENPVTRCLMKRRRRAGVRISDFISCHAQ